MDLIVATSVIGEAKPAEVSFCCIQGYDRQTGFAEC